MGGFSKEKERGKIAGRSRERGIHLSLGTFVTRNDSPYELQRLAQKCLCYLEDEKKKKSIYQRSLTLGAGVTRGRITSVGRGNWIF